MPTERPILFNAEMVRAVLSGAKTMTRRVMKPQPGSGTEEIFSIIPGEWRASGTARAAALRWSCPYGEPGDRLWGRETWRPICISATVDGAAFWSVQYREGFGVMEWGNPARHGARIAPLCDSDRSMYLSETGNLWGNWRPSIFMPRWASRITLEVTEVRAEPVQDISEEDARAEGISLVPFRPDDGFPVCEGFMVGKDDGKTLLATSAAEAFHKLWDSINAKPRPQKTDGVVTHYTSYPWGGESGTFEHRGLPHYIVANPYVFSLSFKAVG